jgi:sugar phosphate isomerase/epimerase
MNYSFMSFSCPGLDIVQLLDTAKLYGYDGIEPRTGCGHMHGIEIGTSRQTLLDAKEKAADCGISICCIATSCSFANPANSAENIDQARRSVDLAAEVGSPVIRVFGGSVPEGVERKRSFDLVVGALSDLSHYARQREVAVCMETHDGWCSPEAVLDIMKAVSHPSICVNWDIMHPVLSASYTVEKSFELLKPWIRHVHVHDGAYDGYRLVFKPIGQGAIDHGSAVKNLRDSGFTGFISGEWIDWEPYDIHLPREIATLRQYERRES